MNNNQTDTEGIDLWEWYDSIINYKWIIAGVTIIGILLSTAYSWSQSDWYTSTIPVKPIASLENNHMEKLKALGLVQFDENELLDRFERHLTDVDLLLEGAVQFKLIGDSTASNENYKQSSESLVRSFKFEYPKTTSSELSGTFTVQGPNKESLKSYIDWILSQANVNLTKSLSDEIYTKIEFKKSTHEITSENISEEIQSLISVHQKQLIDQSTRVELEISKLKDNHNTNMDDEINQLEQEIERIKSTHHINLEDAILSLEIDIKEEKKKQQALTADRIEFLEEQLSIANAVGLDLPYAVELKNDAQYGTHHELENLDLPYFYLGRIAISKEIDEISNRDGFEQEAFTPKLRELEKQKSIIANKTGKEEFVPTLRELQSRLKLLNFMKNNDAYISGLRPLEIQLEYLDSQKGEEFVSGIRELQETLSRRQNDLEIDRMEKAFNNFANSSQPHRFVDTDSRRAHLTNSSSNPFFILILGTIISIVVGAIIAILRQSRVNRDKLSRD